MGLGCQAPGQARVFTEGDAVLKAFKLKLNRGRGVAPSGTSRAWVIDCLHDTQNSYSALSSLLLFQKTLVLRCSSPHEK